MSDRQSIGRARLLRRVPLYGVSKPSDQSAGDPLQVELDQLTRGELAGGDQLGLAGDSGKCEVGGVHWAGNLLNRATPPP